MACLRSAFLPLARPPALTLAITLIFGAGLGLNVCLFRAFDQLVLRPPAAHELDSLLVALEVDPSHAYRGRAVAPADLVSRRRHTRAFSHLAASESRPAQLGSLDTAILGQSLRIDGTDHVVIGVMPSGFGLPRGMAELWLPRPFVPAELAADRPVSHSAQLRTVNVLPAPRWAVEDIVQRFPERLLAAAGCVLLAARANVANLQIARGLGIHGLIAWFVQERTHELGVRIALGADPRPRAAPRASIRSWPSGRNS